MNRDLSLHATQGRSMRKKVCHGEVFRLLLTKTDEELYFFMKYKSKIFVGRSKHSVRTMNRLIMLGLSL